MQQLPEHMTKETRNVPCVLTEEEILKHSRKMAKEQQDKMEAEAEKSAVNADYNDKIKRHEAEIGGLARKVSNGYEHRDIECEWSFDFERGVKTLYRHDTGEKVDSKGISEYERQQYLDFEREAREDNEKESAAEIEA